MTDPIVEAVKADHDARSAQGIATYGVTLAANPAPFRHWLQQLYEERLDAIVYCQRALADRECSPYHAGILRAQLDDEIGKVQALKRMLATLDGAADFEAAARQGVGHLDGEPVRVVADGAPPWRRWLGRLVQGAASRIARGAWWP